MSSIFSATNKSLIAIASTGLTVILIWKLRKKYQLRKLRQKWNNAEKDVVILHQFGRGKYCPNLSPFALKVETFLRLNNIKYEVETTSPFGSKGKCPWINLNGEEVADSEFIIEKLVKVFHVNLDNNLSKEEIAVLEAVKILVEEHLFWCVITWRYWLDKCNSFNKSQDFPFFLKLYFPLMISTSIKHRSKIQGIGKHSSEEIYLLCRKDCATLSTILGQKDYFGGKSPCTTDCAIFGGLSQLMWNAPGSKYEALVREDFKNLERYCIRMKETVFPHWDKVTLQ